MDYQLTLFGTEACHLCEEALTLTLQQIKNLDITFNNIDIVGDNALEELYGLRIPVLVHGGQELCWPFTAEQCAAFIADIKN